MAAEGNESERKRSVLNKNIERSERSSVQGVRNPSKRNGARRCYTDRGIGELLPQDSIGRSQFQFQMGPDAQMGVDVRRCADAQQGWPMRYTLADFYGRFFNR